MITLDSDRRSCGCDYRNGFCDCVVDPFTVTRSELRRMNKGKLFALYTRCINDEMGPFMWRGFTKASILEMFLSGGDSVELTPFF